MNLGELRAMLIVGDTIIEELTKDDSQHPKTKQQTGGELKPCVGCGKSDNGSPADTQPRKTAIKYGDKK